MTRAIIMPFHLYTPFGKSFYEPMLEFQMRQLREFQDEFDTLYLVDSNWDIQHTDWDINFPKKTICKKVSPHLRYYDAYKEVLPQIEEDLVLFMDNDMVVYKKGAISLAFNLLDPSFKDRGENGREKGIVDVISIYDTIGTWTTDRMNGKNKFCPYWFATRKELLMKYLDVDWGDHMPEHETLGKLTEVMINDDVIPYEWQEDKNSIYFDGTQDGEKGKDLGYYHIRAGSAPAYLLATKKYGDMNTYLDYMKNQPTREYLRQAAWYRYMGGEWEWPGFEEYYQKFLQYHNLP